MRGRGYREQSSDRLVDDDFVRPPVYHFEFHRTLFGRRHDQVFVRYYENVHKRLIPDEARGMRLRFSPEDFYIYQNAHAYKHFHRVGTGLRSILDTYVFLSKCGSGLDRAYADGELEKLGIADFERLCRAAADRLFGGDTFSLSALTEEEEAFVAECAAAGAFGTTELAVRKGMRAMDADGTSSEGEGGVRRRLRYVRYRLLPPWYKQHAPVVGRHPWLIPFYVIYRVLWGVFARPRQLWGEIRSLWKDGK